MRIYNFAIGVLLIALFFCALIGVGLNGFLEKTILDIQNNIPISTAILLTLIVSLFVQAFVLHQSHYVAGIIFGLGVSTLLTGFEGSIGLALCAYSGFIQSQINTHNKFKNEKSASGSDASTTRPF